MRRRGTILVHSPAFWLVHMGDQLKSYWLYWGREEGILVEGQSREEMSVNEAKEATIWTMK